MKGHWFATRERPPPARSLALKVGSFVLPLVLWCAISYLPFLWHPMVKVADPGESSFLQQGMLVERQTFAAENAALASAGRAPAAGRPANPVFLPAPHEVVRAFYTAFTTPPQRRGEPWLHQSLAHSLRIILLGFTLSAVVGVPLGILCGAFASVSRLIEPFVDFIRYMPPPVFGALAIAVLGIDDAPKVAIVFIGTVFQMIRVVANTTRTVDPALLEAALTLGTSPRRLVTRVILPGMLPSLYNDLRILLGCAWTLLTIAELIGATTGISYFINQQGKYRHYDNVFAGIVMIGLLGMIVDKVLCMIGARLFPWQGPPAVGFWGEVWSVLMMKPRPTAAVAAPVGAGATPPPAADGDALRPVAQRENPEPVGRTDAAVA